jgi:hypothetical protein
LDISSIFLEIYLYFNLLSSLFYFTFSQHLILSFTNTLIMETISFTVSFKGKSIPFTNWAVSTTVGHVKSKLADETNIVNDHQKLMWKGKILQDDQATLDTLAIPAILSKAKFMLTGTTQQDQAAVQQLDKNIAALQQRRSTPAKRPFQRPRPVQDIKYTFHRISVLPEFHQQDKARQLLERLRDDRGVRAIMNQRKWSVGELIELSPFEVSILGYNRNAGQLIAIRLRTDDLTGFRHYDSIRKVLLHELTHNVSERTRKGVRMVRTV